ncbi:MAG TPA: hypothetical protein VH913_15635 [Hyphomicrobiaceae bacterium]|jgi:hypothetical protein
MLGTQLPYDADKSLPDLDSLAAAATEMTWAVALATTRAAAASTARGLALWSHLLRASVLWLLPAPWPVAHSLFGPGSRVSADATDEAAAPDAAPGAAPAEGPAFASYRSSGGHAAAQVAKLL